MEKIIEIIQQWKPALDAETLRNATNLYDGEILDGMDVAMIVRNINEAYGISIPNVKRTGLLRGDFRTLNDIYALVQRYGGC